MSFELEVQFLSANSTAFASVAKRLNCIDLHNAGRMDDITIIVSADVVPT